MVTQGYRHGIATKPPQIPEPYWFFWGSAAMGIAGLAAMANARLGVVMAWAFLIGGLTYQYQADKTKALSTAANTNPSALAANNTVRRTA